jgi:hypothetical protein
MGQIANIDYFWKKCNQILGTSYYAEDSKTLCLCGSWFFTIPALEMTEQGVSVQRKVMYHAP